MGTNTITEKFTNDTIIKEFFNDLRSASIGDIVGRDSSGVAAASQNSGSISFPWGTIYANSMVLGGAAVDTSLLTAPKNRIVSGKTRSTSNQPQFILPNGAAASFILEGATTNLVLDINGVAVTVSTDIVKSGLTVGPSTTATCLINDLDAIDQESTRTWGEYQSEKETITVDTMGAEFQTFIGQWVIVLIAGVANEYALAFVKSATELTDIYRGFFTNSSSVPVNRTKFSNNDVVTVLSTGWVFVENNGTTVDVTYTNPIRAFSSPAAPSAGDYWYDLTNKVWKRYTGAVWDIINRTLVGIVGIDSSNCVAARSFDFFAKYQDTNNIEIEINTTEIVQMKSQNSKVNVYGNEINFGFNHQAWDITTDLAASTEMYNATEQSSTQYYIYLKDTGEAVLSDVSPHWRPDLLGFYSPSNPWRCIGSTFNDSSLNLILVDELRYNKNLIQKTAYIKDLKSSGISGGTFTSGAWQDRVLNTLEGDSSFISVSSNEITLHQGKYRIESSAPAAAVNRHQSKLLNTADSTETLGSSESANPASTASTRSFVKITLEIVESKTFKIQHRCETTRSTDGFGVDSSFGTDNVYTNIEVIKLR